VAVEVHVALTPVIV
jgi:hypothetical protein